ncbi:hypothetical protein D1164_17345 [Mariniphaga sediminis]|uniref:Uncharacterized protein n=1 Tax=Mariniphaga sediminis TaxID=1628158 RepID=A0A399CXL3_9BACT|nr:hypothetical protein D1164_17345 [Mariniphaga sediminis]
MEFFSKDGNQHSLVAWELQKKRKNSHGENGSIDSVHNSLVRAIGLNILPEHGSNEKQLGVYQLFANIFGNSIF